jgi:DNA-binding response OmpR family regulator
MKVKLLLVDDEVDALDFLKKRLEAHRYEVVAASNGEEGVRKAVEERPDLILLDIMMAGKDGLAVFKELKAAEATQSIPVIMLTAKVDTASIMQFQALGVEDYMLKPFDFEELLKYIKKFTE